MDFREGAESIAENPLKTSYDLANIYMQDVREPLACSPYLYVWSSETEEKYSKMDGLWLSHTNEHLTLKYGKGSKNFAADCEFACFFPVFEEDKNQRHTIRLVVTCMN